MMMQTFFKVNLFQKNISGILSECQTVWIQSRIDVLSILIWVQTVCKGYQQMTKVDASKEKIEDLDSNWRPISIEKCHI